MNSNLEIKDRKNILVLTSTFPRWADDKDPPFVFNLCKQLSKEFNISVIAPHCAGARKIEIIEGIRIIRYQYFLSAYQSLAYEGGIISRIKENKFRLILIPFFLIFQIVTIARLIKKERFYCIHAHWVIPQGICAVLATKLTASPVPVICTLHGADLFALNGKFITRLKLWTLKNCEKVTVVSGAMRNVLLNMGLVKPDIEVISMGVDLKQKFIPDGLQTGSANRVIFAGRLVEKKGVKYLIDAFQIVQKTHPDLKLLIAGQGPEKNILESQVASLKLNDKITFLGAVAQNDLIELYQKSNIAVFPFVIAKDGDQEGLGLVVVEAMGCECAVIASDLPAIKDTVTNKVNGLLAEPGDVGSLADQIVYLLDNPEVAMKFAAQGRSDMLSKYDWSIIGQRYTELLSSVTD